MSYIVEIAVEVRNHAEQEYVEQAIRDSGIAFYVEPPHDPPWESLEVVEAECEGK